MIQIREFRERCGFTQQQLAEKIQENRATVAKWEIGSAFPRAEKLPALADALHCSIDDLFGRGKEEKA